MKNSYFEFAPYLNQKLQNNERSIFINTTLHVSIIKISNVSILIYCRLDIFEVQFVLYSNNNLDIFVNKHII